MATGVRFGKVTGKTAFSSNLRFAGLFPSKATLFLLLFLNILDAILIFSGHFHCNNFQVLPDRNSLCQTADELYHLIFFIRYLFLLLFTILLVLFIKWNLTFSENELLKESDAFNFVSYSTSLDLSSLCNFFKKSFTDSIIAFSSWCLVISPHC